MEDHFISCAGIAAVKYVLHSNKVKEVRFPPKLQDFVSQNELGN